MLRCALPCRPGDGPMGPAGDSAVAKCAAPWLASIATCAVSRARLVAAGHQGARRSGGGREGRGGWSEGSLGVEEGDVDVLATARRLSVAQSRQDADRGVHARKQVRHRHPHLPRRPAATVRSTQRNRLDALVCGRITFWGSPSGSPVMLMRPPIA